MTKSERFQKGNGFPTFVISGSEANGVLKRDAAYSGLKAWILNVIGVAESVANECGFAEYATCLNGCVVYPFGVTLKEEWADERFVEGQGF